MRKVELLSPVGNIEMAHLAIHNGADAIYLAGKAYGARKYAENFTNEELVNIIEYAHLYGVKVYVTVNTIIYENELSDVLDYVEFLYINQVDALIMQDIGLITLIRRMYPNLEIHASTQCHNHNNSILELWKNLGVKRVVLAREMTTSQIKELKSVIEKEIFIYGALCICYSGCCLFSSLNGGRSGNRGECVGCCRLPYQLSENGKRITTDGNYLLSTKELNTLNNLNELIELGIDSFKIEGRMKSPSYVGYVTKCARRIIDAYYEGKTSILTKEEEINLKKLFNRGFTKGYLFDEENIMNTKSPNHQGIEIGTVIEVKRNKIKIKLIKDSLHQEDGIRFKNANVGMIVNHLYNEKGLLINEINKGNICYLDKKDNIKVGDILLKTIDSELTKEIKQYKEKKINVTMKAICKIGTAIKIEMTDGENQVSKTGEIVEKALKQKVDTQSIKRQLSKLGNTPYTLDKLEIDSDNNIFIRLSTLNEIRRFLTEELTNMRKKKKVHDVVIKRTTVEETIKSTFSEKYSIHALVRTESQLKACLEHHVESIYVTDYELYKKYRNKKNIYYRIDRVNYEEPIFTKEKLLVGDLGSAYLYSKENNVVTDYYLNIVNHASIKALRNLNVERVTISVELNDDRIKDLMEKVGEKERVEMIIYGRVELMITKHYLGEYKCSLIDKYNHQYPVMYKNNLSHIFAHEVINKIEKMNNYHSLGITNYRIELFEETKEEVEKILKSINKN